MRGNEKVIAALNEALGEELTAINQYFLHAEMQAHWGYRRLYEKVRSLSIQEMRHAEWLIERILFLEGMPNMTGYGQLNIGQEVRQQLANDLALEHSAIAMYNRAIQVAEEAGDRGSRELLEKLLADEEEHADWLETQLGLIREVGLEHYLAQQIHPAE
ncbi:MAG: bacterioferritin [Bryobacterales bacterium]|nr:bacterioferritin [Bryobacteraceae bacterium]MDW8131666.1 bacterioferritin [Bryobacterales bacterium]